ncbi:hypothetical protein [Acetobacter senegalensis]|uniref:hypothetical protein n=1 Tax=Acetobacter senegalensis TaxID=446692 RepID=UPI0012FD375A|nr:hypothetical protein [Acetobacter senegalensis]
MKSLSVIVLLSSAAHAAEGVGGWQFHAASRPQGFFLDSHQRPADLLIQLDPAGAFVMTVFVKDPHATVADLRFESYALHLFNIQSLPQGTLFSAEISNKDLKAFVHGLTSAQKGTLTTDGGAETQISLAGTSSAVDALNAYAASNNLALPPPFTSNRPAGDELSDDMQALTFMKSAHPAAVDEIASCARTSTAHLPRPISPDDMKQAFLACSEPREAFRMLCAEDKPNATCLGAASAVFLGVAGE